MARPVSFLTDSYMDYGREMSHVRYAGVALTAGNFTAQNTAAANLKDAEIALTLGNLVNYKIQAYQLYAVPTPPTEKAAQRENKWLVRYHDSANKRFSVEIPCADLSLLVNNTEFIDLSTGAGAAYKTAFEAYVKSPDDDTLSCTLDSVQFVGRRN